jgi:hypothetical protein
MSRADKSRYSASQVAPLLESEGTSGHVSCDQYLTASRDLLLRFDYDEDEDEDDDEDEDEDDADDADDEDDRRQRRPTTTTTDDDDRRRRRRHRGRSYRCDDEMIQMLERVVLDKRV